MSIKFVHGEIVNEDGIIVLGDDDVLVKFTKQEDWAKQVVNGKLRFKSMRLLA